MPGFLQYLGHRPSQPQIPHRAGRLTQPQEFARVRDMATSTCLRKLPLTSALAAAVALTLAPALVAGTPLPLGPEVPLDAPSKSFGCPQVAGRGDGSFVVGWTREASDAYPQVLVRAGDAAGALGPEESIDTDANVSPRMTSLVATPPGFTLLWRVLGTGRTPYLGAHLASDGTTVGDVIHFEGDDIIVSSRPVGGFVAAWADDVAIFVQLIDRDGHPERPVVRLQAPDVESLVIAQRANGEFVLCWQSLVSARESRVGFERGTFAQPFDAEGRKLGHHFLLVPGGGFKSRLFRFAAAWRDDGTLVFAWVVEPPVRLGRPPGTWQLLVRSFADSRPLGPALRVASVKDREGFALILSSIAVDPAGRVLIAWLDYEALHASTAWAQLVSPRGTASGARFAVASPESAEHAFAFCANAAWSGEAWLVAWAAADKPFVDQRSNRSFLRRFSGR